jgi:hypothetical protein
VIDASNVPAEARTLYHYKWTSQRDTSASGVAIEVGLTERLMLSSNGQGAFLP